MDSAGSAVAAWTFLEPPGDQRIQASVKPAGGAFPAPSGVVNLTGSTTGDASDPEVAMNGGGATIVVWAQGSPSLIQAAVRNPGGSFGPGTPISAPGADALFPGVAVGPSGDAVVGWRSWNGANWIAQAAGYDANSPVFRSLSIPAQGTVGVPVAFSADPFDVWPITSTTFAFGDGTGASGTSVSHVYGAPGVYPVTVSATDVAGNPVTAGGAISIAPRASTLRIGKRKRNRKKGTVLLTVHVSGPGKVSLSGRGVTRKRKRARRAGPVRLLVKAKGKLLKQLNSSGKARTQVTITFRPDDGGSLVRKRVRVVMIKN
jgi:hypothetical protein